MQKITNSTAPRIVAITFIFFITVPLLAQDGIQIHTLNTARLPHIQLSIATKPPDLLPPGTRITVLDNGIPVQTSTLCDETSSQRNITLCLDFSGSIKDAYIDIKNAALSLMDSLKTGDRVGLALFTVSDLIIVHRPTFDHQLIRNEINRIQGSYGNTPFFAALDSSAMILKGLTGQNIIVALSDGEDNMWGPSLEKAAKSVLDAKALLFCVRFGKINAGNWNLIRLAQLSKGAYLGDVDFPSFLAAFNTTADLLKLGFCDLEFDISDCVDTVRTISVLAETGFKQYRADTTIVIPPSADSIHVYVDAPDNMFPQTTHRIGFYANGYFPFQPLQMYVRFHYLSALGRINSAAILANGIFAGQYVMTELLGKDTVTVSYYKLFPLRSEGLLFSFDLAIHSGDSLRQMPIIIDSVYFGQTCPIAVSVEHDTIGVCMCTQHYTFIQPEILIASVGAIAMLPLTIDGLTVEDKAFRFTGEIHYDPAEVEFLSIHWSDAVLYDSTFHIERSDPGRLSVQANNELRVHSTPVTIASALFRVKKESYDPLRRTIFVEDFHYYSNCCPLHPLSDSMMIFSDGICNRIIRRGPTPMSVALYPNPTIDQHQVTITTAKDCHVRLEMYAMNGTLQGVIYEGSVSRSLTINNSFRSSQGGCYYYVARTDEGATITKPFVVVR